MAKQYEKTHPWLTFKLNPQEFSHNLQVDLKECVSEARQLQHSPMSPKLRHALSRVYLSKVHKSMGMVVTTIIEGSILDEEIVQETGGGDALPAQNSDHILWAKNVIGQFHRILGDAQKSDLHPLKPLMPQTLHVFQSAILHGIPTECGNIGKVRERLVGVPPSYSGAPHRECQYLLDFLCAWLHEDECFKALQGEFNRETASIIRAIMAHLYIVWIHPYDGGNGRTARMAEFYILVAAGFSTTSAHLLSNHCNRLRDEYYCQLRQAKEIRNPREFICFMVRGLRDGLREQLKLAENDVVRK